MAGNDWRMTRDSIITAALRKVGAVASGATPTSAQLSDGSDALNALVKGWQSLGVRLWTVEWNTQRVAEGKVNYGLDPILDIQKAFVRRDGTDYPVDIKMIVDYFDIPNKDDPGMAQVIALKQDAAFPEMYVYPAPDNSTDVLHFLQVRKLTDLDDGEEYPDFPSQWIQPLIWNLASELAPEFGLPLDLRQDLLGRATGYLEIAMRGERGTTKTADFVRGCF
jgi:hypothetical protein